MAPKKESATEKKIRKALKSKAVEVKPKPALAKILRKAAGK